MRVSWWLEFECRRTTDVNTPSAFTARSQASPSNTTTALVPFLLEGFSDSADFFQADRIHPSAQAQARILQTVWPVLAADDRGARFNEASASLQVRRGHDIGAWDAAERSVISAADALLQLSQFDSLIDVRTEAEFAIDHLPGAINCPVLTDAERVEVGTMDRQQSSFEARRRGAAYVSRNIALHLETLFRSMPKTWRPLVYCWRGGNRSAAMTHILRCVGWQARQLEGGYRAYRRCIVTDLAHLPARLSLRVICGTTGSGKSRLLQELSVAGCAGAGS